MAIHWITSLMTSHYDNTTDVFSTNITAPCWQSIQYLTNEWQWTAKQLANNQHQAFAYASAVTNNIFDWTLSPPDRPADRNLSYKLQSTNIPSNLQQVTRTTSGKRLGMNSDFKPGLQKTNSLHLAKLMESLLDFDHDIICFISSSTGTSLFSGTNKLKSPA